MTGHPKMPEELSGSSGSGRSNPRLRNTQRVRPVPYECCGGLYNFFSTGCLSMCCAAPKTRRNSAYSKRRNSKTKKDKISEPPKRLIKPNIGDGITESEKDEFKTSDPILFYPNEDDEPGGLYVSKFDIDIEDDIVSIEKLEHQRETFSLNIDDNVSQLTTDISVTGSEASGKLKKSKKRLVNILRFRKKKKNSDDTNSNSSIAQSDNAAESQSNFESTEAENKDTLTNIQENDAVDSVHVEEIQETFNDELDIEGKTQTQSERKHDLVDESDFIKVAKILPLGASATKPELSLDELDETAPETPTPSQEKRKKKMFWRSSSRKTKPENAELQDGSKSDSEQKPTPKKNFLGKWGSLKRTQNLNQSTDVENDALNVTESENEAPKEEIKKKTLFGTLKLSRKSKTKDQKNDSNDCTTPTGEKKTSSDSVEIKTIESGDGPLEDDACPIKIIRNQFFLAEINSDYHNRGNCNANDALGDVGKKNEGNGRADVLDTNQENVQDAKEKFVTESYVDDNLENEVKNGDLVEKIELVENDALNGIDKGEEKLGKTEEGDIGKDTVSSNAYEQENLGRINEDDVKDGIGNKKDNMVETDAEEFQSTKEEERVPGDEEVKSGSTGTVEAQDHGKTPIEKQYGIIDKEDFSESLHTLVDNDPDYIILATTEVCLDRKSEITSLPDELFRSSYATSIDSSVQDTQSEKAEENFAIFAMSTDTLVQTNSIIERSTETLTDAKEAAEAAAAAEWIEITNADQLNDSQFGYIYKSTMKHVLNEEMKKEEEEEAKVENCDKCKVEVKCVCTTLTQARPSVGELEEGNVKSKIEAFNHAEHPIITPLGWQNDGEKPKDDVIISEAHSSPTLGSKTGSKSATPSPIAAKSRSGTLSSTNSEWQHAEEDIDRLMVMQGRSSLSSLGLRSDSMASVYSGAGEGRYGTVTVKGQVEFGLQYNYKAGALEIHVKQCKDLASVDTKRNRSDPYVKVYLLPDKSKSGKRKTKVKKHTLNPVFDETLKFHISLNGLETRTLWLTVWHSDMFGRNDFLGEVMMALENKVFDDPTPKLYNLQERTEPFDDTISFKGDIIVCLKFVPPDMTVQKKGKRSRGTLNVLVKEAKSLTAYKANGTSDPFCKSYLLPDKGRNSKQKTAVVKKTVNPVWNHTFIYDDVTLQELAERCLELTVWDHDRLASNEFLGGVRFSLGTGKHYGKSVEWMDSSGKEVSLWKNMLERPNFWVEGSLSLRPTLDARTS